jgi:hypothetical protein
MLIYFIIATVLCLGIIIWAHVDDWYDNTVPVIVGGWAFLVLLPSLVSTADVKVEPADGVKVYMLSPYEAILLEAGQNAESYKTITDAYTLSQIPKGNYVIYKHECYNMWGGIVQDELFLRVTPKK